MTTLHATNNENEAPADAGNARVVKVRGCERCGLLAARNSL